jgi:transaldolase
MEIFIDTASVSEIKNILPWGIISGVTTNQKIFLAEKGCDFKKRVMEILSLVDGPVSVELTKTDATKT